MLWPHVIYRFILCCPAFFWDSYTHFYTSCVARAPVTFPSFDVARARPRVYITARRFMQFPVLRRALLRKTIAKFCRACVRLANFPPCCCTLISECVGWFSRSFFQVPGVLVEWGRRILNLLAMNDVAAFFEFDFVTCRKDYAWLFVLFDMVMRKDFFERIISPEKRILQKIFVAFLALLDQNSINLNMGWVVYILYRRVTLETMNW